MRVRVHAFERSFGLGLETRLTATFFSLRNQRNFQKELERPREVGQLARSERVRRRRLRRVKPRRSHSHSHCLIRGPKSSQRTRENMPRGLFQKPTLYDLFFLSLEALWARGEHSARGELEQRQQASCDRSPKVEIQREDTRCPGLSTPFSRLALPPESSPGLEPPTIAPVVARLAASGGDFTESVSRVYKRTRNTHPSRCTAVARLTCERATGDADRRLWGVSRRLSSSSPRTGGPLVERERRGGARENGGEVLGAFARDEREDVVRARVAVGEATCAENQILQRVSRLSLSLSLSLGKSVSEERGVPKREREASEDTCTDTSEATTSRGAREYLSIEPSRRC